MSLPHGINYNPILNPLFLLHYFYVPSIAIVNQKTPKEVIPTTLLREGMTIYREGITGEREGNKVNCEGYQTWEFYIAFCCSFFSTNKNVNTQLLYPDLAAKFIPASSQDTIKHWKRICLIIRDFVFQFGSIKNPQQRFIGVV